MAKEDKIPCKKGNIFPATYISLNIQVRLLCTNFGVTAAVYGYLEVRGAERKTHPPVYHLAHRTSRVWTQASCSLYIYFPISYTFPWKGHEFREADRISWHYTRLGRHCE